MGPSLNPTEYDLIKNNENIFYQYPPTHIYNFVDVGNLSMLSVMKIVKNKIKIK